MKLSVTCLSGILVVVLAAAMIFSLAVGRYPLDLSLLAAGLRHHNSYVDEIEQIMIHIRLPRMLAAVLVGAALATAGAVYQVMFRNPLVSPDILGVSAGAGFGAIFAIYMNWPVWLIEISAFGCGLLAVMLVYLLSRHLKRLDNTLVLILTGVVISALGGSMVSLLKILADPYTQLSTMTFWLMGGLNTVQYSELLYTTPGILLALIPIVLLRWRINLLNLSDDESRTLGLNPNRLRLLLIVSATLMTSSVVAISGMIGWVGLIIPHIARLLVGARFTAVLLLSLMLGPIFLLLADTASRMVATIDLPLSILTSFIGTPFFIFLLVARNRKA